MFTLTGIRQKHKILSVVKSQITASNEMEIDENPSLVYIKEISEAESIKTKSGRKKAKKRAREKRQKARNPSGEFRPGDRGVGDSDDGIDIDENNIIELSEGEEQDLLRSPNRNEKDDQQNERQDE